MLLEKLSMTKTEYLALEKTLFYKRRNNRLSLSPGTLVTMRLLRVLLRKSYLLNAVVIFERSCLYDEEAA